MVIATSGAVAFSTIASEFSGYVSGTNVGSSYYGKYYYKADGVLRQFPSSSFPMSLFYGTSPDNEWACACDCNCSK